VLRIRTWEEEDGVVVVKKKIKLKKWNQNNKQLVFRSVYQLRKEKKERKFKAYLIKYFQLVYLPLDACLAFDL